MIKPSKIIENGPKSKWIVILTCEACNNPSELKYKSYLAACKKDKYVCLSCAMSSKKDQISKLVSERWKNEEYRDKVSNSLTKFRQSDKWDDVKKGISEKLKTYYSSDALKEIARINAEEGADPEAQSKRSKIMWEDEEVRAKIVNKLKDNAVESKALRKELKDMFRKLD